MPTPYTNNNEMMVLQEYIKKIAQTEKVDSFEKSEIPDGIIRTENGRIIGVEVTSAIRTNDSGTTPKEKNAIASFLNQYGVYNPNAPQMVTLSENFNANEYILGLISKITERIQDKEGKKSYSDFRNRFNESIMIIYVDDPLITEDALKMIASENSYRVHINIFDKVYIYIRRTFHTSPTGIKMLNGFYPIASRIKDNV